MSPPPAKKRKTIATTKPMLMSLPYELLLDCLARVSRVYYPTLSLVSKRFRSLLASPDLYKVRSLLGRTESCLYVCVNSYSESFWYTLCQKPGNKDKGGYVLARVPTPYSPCAHFEDLVVAGSSIYHIARPRSDRCLPATISILDCRSHTWRKAPSMRVGLVSFTATLVGPKIYVLGFSRDDGNNSIEVFDTRTETWDPEPIPCSEIYHGSYNITTCIGGKLYVVHRPGRNVVTYDSKEGTWNMVEWSNFCAYVRGNSYCVIDNVFYTVNDGVILWYDTKVSLWTELKGLVGLPELPPVNVHTCVRLADYGGKIVVFWNEKSISCYYTTITVWCAVVALERRPESCEIWGQVEWCGHVLNTTHWGLEKVLAVNV